MSNAPRFCMLTVDEITAMASELTVLRGIAGEVLLALGFDGEQPAVLDESDLVALLERHGAVRRLSAQVVRFPGMAEQWVQTARDRTANPIC